MPALYCGALGGPLRSIARQVRQACFPSDPDMPPIPRASLVLSILDDIFLVAPKDVAETALEVVCLELQRINQALSLAVVPSGGGDPVPGKCRCFAPDSPQSRPPWLQGPIGSRVGWNPEGVVILGAPVGTPSFVASAFSGHP